jgi:hypothetical protein
MDDLPRLKRTIARRSRLENQGTDQRVVDYSPEECLNMVWPLTLTAWSLADPDLVEPRLQRTVVRVYRLGN